MNAAAVILCAGKGTRMNDTSINKVCFPCAGVPVIRRIVTEMQKGGVTRFVIVVGHEAQTVMDSLDGVAGVVYAYQKEQRGTGHAALCGLNALASIGYSGPAVVSMGDKIVSSSVIAGLLERASHTSAVWGIQPVEANPNGGRVVISDGKPYGVVELADAALMALAGVDPERRGSVLRSIGLNEKKSAKVLARANETNPTGSVRLCEKTFSAAEILASRYANAGLYCFDTKSAIEAIGTCGSDNAQGEIYLTDTLTYFAERGAVETYTVKDPLDMLTYSTKKDLQMMSRNFFRTTEDFRTAIRAGELDGYFFDVYENDAAEEKARYLALIDLAIRTYGNEKAIFTRSPGRVNLMGRHIDHRGGGINVMAIDKDTLLIASPRDDDTIRYVNLDPAYPEGSFSIGETLNLADHTNWLDYLAAKPVVDALRESRGDWSNYIKSAVLRFQLANELPFCGMNLTFCGNIPVAAGLSSSSSIVVATAEAVVALNSLHVTKQTFIDLCGEGEWFVGSRGGAGDHAAMKCCQRGKITHLGFKPFSVGASASFTDRYAVVVADSMMKAKKSEGSKDKFNAKVASYEFSLMYLKRAYPERDLREFRDLAAVRPFSEIYKMLKTLPERVTRADILRDLSEYGHRIGQIFSNHADPGVYDLRGVALYGISECVRSERCMDTLNRGDYILLGRLMKISHDGDRLRDLRVTDETLDALAATDADPAMQSGAYGCSTERIDRLCDLLNSTDGVLGSEIVGAGLGGCVIALIEKAKAQSILDRVNREYYDAYGCPHAANVYLPSPGSAVLF